MHFSIPDTQDITVGGSSYKVKGSDISDIME